MTKYRNIPTVVNNIRFASRKEAEFYMCLKQQLRDKKIVYLKCHPYFPLIPANDKFRGVSYIADFETVDKMGKRVIYDVKSEITRKNQVYILKKKLMYHIHRIEIQEV